MAAMMRKIPWLCFWLAAQWIGAGCGSEVDLHFGKSDASFASDAGDAGDAASHGGGSGSNRDEDGGGAAADEDGGTAANPPPADAGSTPASGSAAAEFPSRLAQATCDALEACYGNANLLADVLGGRDCVKLYTGELGASDLSYLSQSIAAGLIKLQASNIDTCLADVRALGCDVRASRLPASCKDALRGTVLVAGECTTNLDCQGDAFCDKGTQATCPGVCSALQAESFPCNNNDDAQCQNGLVCFRGTCEALGTEGQQCGTDLPRCKPGLTCFDQGKGLVCVTIDTVYSAKLGQKCNDAQGTLCQPGLVCESVSSTSGKCADTVSAGASCKRAVPNQCPLDQYCDATNPGESGSCVDRPGEGEACLSRTPACADGYACIDKACSKIQDNGASCSQDAQCYGGTCSDGKCAGALMCAPP
jgi:hypothetical protein